MDLALLAMRQIKKDGNLKDQEETDEINACSIVVPLVVDGKEEEWLVNFKNETHNHPTEIEPFGGAATCLGGCIRDPLSGRTYVYQAMRVTGAADPTIPVKDTLEGKLPQRKIVTEAAHGYSSYGNQIGLATGLVKEIYHPGYVAKRMEIGAVMGAAPRRAVKRLTSDPGDIIVLLGGRTGRDGIGGATGSSKKHVASSIETSGAEVQKGNPPIERKIQRLFRREEVSSLIKKCNDFGAGGVSVAIGELADGLKINLDKVPKKYEGLDGTELAISESQERMAVVLDPKDVDKFMDYAKEENLEAAIVAVVTEEPRMILTWRDKEIVNLKRAFIDTNGAHQETDVFAELPIRSESTLSFAEENLDIKSFWLKSLDDLNVTSQKGLVEMFDGSIGAGSTFMPFGGKNQATETQSMVAKIPTGGECEAVSMMSYGFDPYISSWSPYHGAIYAILDSVAKIVASGGDYKKIRFTFQEYFKRLGNDPKRWGVPFLALLGAFDAQMKLSLPSIGGKDSMSGTFENIDVPPTLVSFAVDIANEKDIITPEFKKSGNKLALFEIGKDSDDLPDYNMVKDLYNKIHDYIISGKIVSAYALDRFGIAVAISKMGFGNGLGAKINDNVSVDKMFGPTFGNIVVELAEGVDNISEGQVIGEVIEDKFIYKDVEIQVSEAYDTWSKKLSKVYPVVSGKEETTLKYDKDTLYNEKNIYINKNKIAKPKVFIPVFPGTNCEYDSARAFEKAGADTSIKVFKNLNSNNISESISLFAKEIENSQIIMFPGGFSAGDEPDGSAKFFSTAFKNGVLNEAVSDLLNKRDGLILGICNGFQTLVKLGLLPYGKIMTQESNSPTLTYNTIGRHISKMVYTKVVSNKSPWLSGAILGDVYCNPASHGEGRFVADDEWIEKLFANGQVATRYSDPQGNISMDELWNVNGSFEAIEGITSPDGRILGKMAHSERCGKGVAKNIYGNQDIKIFQSGVEFFK
jgi:phosphoribosylformylglycinamidine synthase